MEGRNRGRAALGAAVWRAAAREAAGAAAAWAALRVRAGLAAPAILAPGGGALLAAAAMAFGAAAYVGAPGEPPVALSWSVAGLGLFAAVAARRRSAMAAHATAWRVAGMAAALAAVGFAMAQARAHAIASRPLAAPIAAITFAGWVERVDPPSGPRARAGAPQRYVLRVVEPTSGAAAALTRVRVSAPAGAARLGDRVRVRARLWPPPTPPTPGAYDARRRFYFEEINALGRAFALEPAPDLPLPAGQAVAQRIAAARGAVAARLMAAAAPEPGAIAAALITGHRGDIAPEDAETLRAAGLGHILAISGLHMALIAGGAYWAASFLFASIEPLARRGDPRRAAAAAALAVATAYLVFSGAAVSTQRAYVMAAALFVALLLRRRALSLRTLAAAGVVILALRPESAATPGFHMSFAATAALIAAYAAYQRRRERRRREPQGGLIGRAAAMVGRVMVGAALTSVVAGGVTGPIAALHFNRLSLVAIPVNIVLTPVFSLWVTPMAAVAGVLTPFGLEAAPAGAAAAGVEAMLAFADWATPEAETVVASGAPLTLSLALAAVVAACAFELGRWRAALPLAALALLAWRASPPVAAWLGADGDLVVFTEDGVGVRPAYRDDYARGVVMRRSGVAPARARALEDVARCDLYGCVAVAPRYGGWGPAQRVALPATVEALAADCRRAALVLVNPRMLESAPWAARSCPPAQAVARHAGRDVTVYAAPWGLWVRTSGARGRPWSVGRDPPP